MSGFVIYLMASSSARFYFLESDLKSFNMQGYRLSYFYDRLVFSGLSICLIGYCPYFSIIYFSLCIFLVVRDSSSLILSHFSICCKSLRLFYLKVLIIFYSLVSQSLDVVGYYADSTL